MKNILIFLLTTSFVHSIIAQVYYDQDTVFLTVEQAEELPQEIKPILYNNTPNEIRYKWRRTILQGPGDLWIISEDQNFQASLASSCTINLTNITSAGGFFPQIGLDAIQRKFGPVDSLPWIIKFDVLRAPSCDSLYASVIYVVGDLNSSTESSYSDNFSIYPNPCNDYITIDVRQDIPFSVQIIDNIGRTVYEKNNLFGTSILDTHQLPKGAYILRITDNLSKLNYRKFLKV